MLLTFPSSPTEELKKTLCRASETPKQMFCSVLMSYSQTENMLALPLFLCVKGQVSHAAQRESTPSGCRNVFWEQNTTPYSLVISLLHEKAHVSSFTPLQNHVSCPKQKEMMVNTMVAPAVPAGEAPLATRHCPGPLFSSCFFPNRQYFNLL